jgi:hypothetical protein
MRYLFMTVSLFTFGVSANNLSFAADANCALIKTAMDKAQNQSTYHTLGATKQDSDGSFQPSIISVKIGTTTYSKILRAPLPMQKVDNSSPEIREMSAQLGQTLLEGQCQSVGSAVIAGSKANGYTYEQSMLGTKSKSTIWISTASGLPVRQDTVSEMGGALKFLEKLVPKSADTPSGGGLSRTVTLFGEKAKPPAEDGSIDPALFSKLQAMLN